MNGGPGNLTCEAGVSYTNNFADSDTLVEGFDSHKSVVMKTLSDMHEGVTGEITGVINEGRNQHGRKRGLNHNGAARLREMGFYEGQQITVVQNKGNGPLVIKFQDTRMVLGRGLAMKIIMRSNHS